MKISDIRIDYALKSLNVEDVQKTPLEQFKIWFEEALERPFSKMHETNGIPTVDLKVQFKNAARLGEILTKSLWVNELKSSSVICGFQYTNENDKIVLEGEVTLVNVTIAEDRNTIKAEPFNEEMKQKISKFVIQTI